MPVFDHGWITRELRDLNRRIDQLTPSIAKSFLPVTQNIVATVIATVQATYSTTAQMLAKIANPGAIAPTSVASSGPVTGSTGTFNGGLTSQAVHDTEVVVGRVSVWVDGSGVIGFASSSRDTKKDLVPLTDTSALMSLEPQLGRYSAEGDTAPLSQFLIAEDVQAAGFGPDVAPLDADGKAFTVNYSQLVPALIAEVKALRARLDAAGL